MIEIICILLIVGLAVAIGVWFYKFNQLIKKNDMCLDTTQRRAKIAKKDIHCYKVMRVVNTHIRSIYQYHRYYINKLETIDKFGIKKYSTFVSIDEGLHAYISLGAALRNARWNTGIVYNCTIPKGSKYYLGHCEDIVSNQMMITGRCKEKK